MTTYTPAPEEIRFKAPALPTATQNTLSAITDPYHDYNLRATGYPDGTATITSVRRFYEMTTIACPFTLAAGQSWDFHIYTTPVHQKGSVSTGTMNNSTLQLYAANTASVGPVMIVYTLYSPTDTVVSQIYLSLGLSLANISTQPMYEKIRTVSLGIELHNTTAELYRSGSLTTYRINEVFEHHFGWLQDAAAGAITPHSTQLIASYPDGLKGAQQYPNTRTWEAAKGAYCVALPMPDNRFGVNTGSNFYLRNFDGVQGILAFSRSPTNNMSFTSSPLSNVGIFSSRFKDTNQTFTLDYRQILEIIPDPRDTVALSYATTAPKADRLFLKLYLEMFNSIPPGVPVGFNDAGEWFRRIVSIAKSALPLVLPLLPPTARTVVTAATPIVEQIVDRFVPPKEKKKTKNVNKTQRMLTAHKQ